MSAWASGSSANGSTTWWDADELRQEPVPPTSMTEYTASVVRDRILDGHYPLGARLDQRRLAEELGVSIIPVREGLRVLEASEPS